jgi:AcrR family transcriptional regulator
MPDPPLSGRRAQAARNDELILEAAREVFVADPEAPIAAVAERAGVGISALYRRYPSKEELLRRLCADGLARYVEAIQAAVDDPGDPWQAFVTFMQRAVDAESSALTVRLAGTFEPSEELYRESARAGELNETLFGRLRSSAAVRADLEVNDIALVLEQLATINLGDRERNRRLRRRYLALALDGFRAAGAARLPGPPPSDQELSLRWQRRPAPGRAPR